MENLQKKYQWHYAWVILLALILIRAFAGGGINATSGLFLAPVSGALSVGVGTLSIYLSVSSIVMILWLPAAGKIVQKYDIRIVAVIAAVAMMGSFIALGFSNHVWAWYLLTIPQTMGSTILINLLGPILINRWFANNQGLMIGIQGAFVALSGVFWQPFASRLIGQKGWRISYIVIGIIALAVVLICAIFLLRNQPKEKYSFAIEKQKGAKNSLEQVNFSQKVVMQSMSFYLLMLFLVFMTGIGVFSQHIATYGNTLGYTVEQMGRVLSFSSIGAALGAILFGIICDKIGSVKTCYIVIAIGMVALAGFFAAQKGLVLFSISAFLFGILNSSFLVLAPILAMEFYGQKDYEGIYAKLSMGAPIAAVLLVPLYGFIYDATGKYSLVLAAIVVMLVLAALTMFFAQKSYRKLKDK